MFPESSATDSIVAPTDTAPDRRHVAAVRVCPGQSETVHVAAVPAASLEMAAASEPGGDGLPEGEDDCEPPVGDDAAALVPPPPSAKPETGRQNWLKPWSPGKPSEEDDEEANWGGG